MGLGQMPMGDLRMNPELGWKTMEWAAYVGRHLIQRTVSPNSPVNDLSS